MIRAFISGPFRGKDHWAIAQNIRATETVALAAWRLGLATYCPHTSTAHYQDAAPDEVWLRGHIEWLRVSQCVIVLPNAWARSSGTMAELLEAGRCGIPVFEAPIVTDDPAILAHAAMLAIDPAHRVVCESLGPYLGTWVRRMGPQ
jgi:hypothetical protein